MNNTSLEVASVSVVIPNYNNQKFIKRCIQSVISQTYTGIKEIIVVDDASTDNSRDIINSIAKNDIRVIPIYLKKNSKVSAARNAGLKRVTSKYVTFLDGDDYYFNTKKIENEMRLMKDKYGMETITYSYIARVLSDNSLLSLNDIPENKLLEGHIYRKLLLTNSLAYIMRDYCVRTDYLREVGGYNEERSFFEDFELILKLSRNAVFYCTKDFGTGYRVSENGLSNRPYIEQIKTINEIICHEISNYSTMKRLYYLIARHISYSAKVCKYRIKNALKYFRKVG